jgi:hypothetical protein
MKTKERNNKIMGGIAPYEKYTNIYDYLDTRYLDIGKKEWNALNPGNLDFRQTNFALSKPNENEKTGGKKKKSNKGGNNLFNNLSYADLYNVSYLGNKNKYSALDIGNLETRGTNFALQKEGQTTVGGNKNKLKKNAIINISNNKIIDKFLNKIIKRSYHHYKKNKGGGENYFLNDLLINTFKPLSESNDILNNSIFNNKYLGNDKKLNNDPPQKINGTVRSNFEF